MTSGLESEWDYFGRNGRDGQKKKIGKESEKKKQGKSKKEQKMRKLMDKGEKGGEREGYPGPTWSSFNRKDCLSCIQQPLRFTREDFCRTRLTNYGVHWKLSCSTKTVNINTCSSSHIICTTQPLCRSTCVIRRHKWKSLILGRRHESSLQSTSSPYCK